MSTFILTNKKKSFLNKLIKNDQLVIIVKDKKDIAQVKNIFNKNLL